MQDIKKQCDALYPQTTFKINLNKKQHQHKNTECGVFSMAFQILWINFLKKNRNIDFDTIIKQQQYTDDKMKKLKT